MKEITVKELKKKLDANEDVQLIDVREDFEYQVSNLGGKHIPLGSLPTKIEELSGLKEKEIIMICRSGARSANATYFLTQNGFTNVANLSGGMMAWADEIDPELPVA
ncbi:MAG TPA: NADH oxidase [Balneolaceae bacterium]|nr:NADH oxidase [Balneolaceae bacterium]|tara:strand:+ start:51822 stop:52142 length:321 start_codon:yes stop_codon:yes gene_type:complete